LSYKLLKTRPKFKRKIFKYNITFIAVYNTEGNEKQLSLFLLRGVTSVNKIFNQSINVFISGNEAHMTNLRL